MSKNYPVDIKSKIEEVNRWTNPHVAAPPFEVNGGLYSGPQNNSPWMPKAVVPTTTYFMQVLLKNMDTPPPQGAAEQYPGENRLGNNYIAMPGVKWYNDYPSDKGPYRIKVIDTSN